MWPTYWSREDWSKLNVDTLKRTCEDLKLNRDGTKRDLIERIMNHIQEESVRRNRLRDESGQGDERERGDRGHLVDEQGQGDERDRRGNLEERTTSEKIEAVERFHRAVVDFPFDSLVGNLQIGDQIRESENRIIDRIIDRISNSHRSITDRISVIHDDILLLSSYTLVEKFRPQFLRELQERQLVRTSLLVSLAERGTYRERALSDSVILGRRYSENRIDWQEDVPNWLLQQVSRVSNRVINRENSELRHYGTSPHCLPSALAAASNIPSQQHVRDLVYNLVRDQYNALTPIGECIRNYGVNSNEFQMMIQGEGPLDIIFALLFGIASDRIVVVYIQNMDPIYSPSPPNLPIPPMIHVLFNNGTFYLVHLLSRPQTQ